MLLLRGNNLNRKIFWIVFGLVIGAILGSKTVYQSLNVDFLAFCIGGLIVGFGLGLFLDKMNRKKT
jgi:hypothetical protein